MKPHSSYLSLASSFILLATFGCSHDAPTPGAKEHASAVPATDLNLIHVETFGSGSVVSFYEVSAEPGLILTLEEVPSNAQPVLDGPTNLSLKETFQFIRPGTPVPQAVAAANERQGAFRAANPIGPDVSSPAPTVAAQAPSSESVVTAAQALTTWEYFNQRCGVLLNGYNDGLVSCQTQNWPSRVCDWDQTNRRHGARIMYERSADHGYMNIQYRKSTSWTLSVEKDSHDGGFTEGVRYIWTMPDTNNNYDYYYYAFSYNYGNMFVCAGFKD